MDINKSIKSILFKIQICTIACINSYPKTELNILQACIRETPDEAIGN